MKSMEAETIKPFMHTPQVCEDRVVLLLMVTSVYGFLLAVLKHSKQSLGECGFAVT